MNKGYFTDVDDDTMRLGTFYYAGGIYYILRQWLTEPINKTPQEGDMLPSYRTMKYKSPIWGYFHVQKE